MWTSQVCTLVPDYIQPEVEDTVGLSENPSVYPSTQHSNQETDKAVRTPRNEKYLDQVCQVGVQLR